MLQGKGGVGKSLISAFLIQYLRGRDVKVHSFDTDPVNATLSGYKELDVIPLNIMNGDDIDPRCFDPLMEAIFSLPEDGHVVVDNGASSFVPLCSYLIENEAIRLLEEQGHRVLLHSVITGGQAIGDTMIGLKSLATHFATSPLVVWLNSYFGDIAIDGKSFQEFKIYEEYSSNFHAVITIPHRKQATFGKDLEELFAKRQGFVTAIGSGLPIMVKQRLASFWRDAVAEMDKARLC